MRAKPTTNSISKRVASIEADSPSNEELKDFLMRDEPRPGDADLIRRINRHTPAFIKRMNRDELIRYIEERI